MDKFTKGKIYIGFGKSVVICTNSKKHESKIFSGIILQNANEKEIGHYSDGFLSASFKEYVGQFDLNNIHSTNDSLIGKIFVDKERPEIKMLATSEVSLDGDISIIEGVLISGMNLYLGENCGIGSHQKFLYQFLKKFEGQISLNNIHI